MVALRVGGRLCEPWRCASVSDWLATVMKAGPKAKAQRPYRVLLATSKLTLRVNLPCRWKAPDSHAIGIQASPRNSAVRRDLPRHMAARRTWWRADNLAAANDVRRNQPNLRQLARAARPHRARSNRSFGCQEEVTRSPLGYFFRASRICRSSSGFVGFNP